MKKYRLAVLNSHPIQYFAPLYRHIAQEPDIDLTVYYCSQQGVELYRDPGFGTAFKWDIPLLEGYNYRFLPNLRSKGNTGGYLSLINPAIISALWRERYDALWVHGHSYVTHLLAIAAAKVLRIPIMMRGETHLRLKRSLRKRFFRQFVMRSLYWICDVCLPVGTRNTEFYRAHSVSESRLFLVPYTVDNHFFASQATTYRKHVSAIRQEFGIPIDQPVILFASKLIPRKRAMDLLQSYHQLCELNVHATLLFVGSGSEEAALARYVQTHNVPRVYFMGFQNQMELSKFFAIADVFILPSEDEPWGLVINEAMCADLPVITTVDVGAAADLVCHGDTGFVFRTGDIPALTSYLHMLMTDTSLRAHMSQRASTHIAAWDFERCVAGLRSALAYLKPDLTEPEA